MPCTSDTASIALAVTGTPGVLAATVRNPATSDSGTLGDDTTHAVNDTATLHTLADTPHVISNAGGSLTKKGIVVVALNPIWVHATGAVAILPNATLAIDGIAQDERDIDAAGVAMAAGTTQLLSLGSLVGNLSIAPGGSASIVIVVTLKNLAAAADYSFRFGGSRLVMSGDF